MQDLGGKLDLIITAHGIVSHLAMKNSTLRDWDNSNNYIYIYIYIVMNINVRSVFQFTSLAVPFLKERKGNIVHVSSSAGVTPQPGALLFSVSKALVNMLTECCALELANMGIRVNAVAPGFTQTPGRKFGETGQELTNEQYIELARKEGNAIPLDTNPRDRNTIARVYLYIYIYMYI